MLSISKSLFMAAGTLVIGLAAAPRVSAATQNQWYLNAPGDSCQLSLPTTDTVVRPRANGYRNEGTAAKYVICGWGGSNYSGGTVYANVYAMSLDGAQHSMSCTFVAGDTAAPASLTYVTKTLTVGTTGFDYLNLNASDFGGTSGNPFSNFNLSATCNLPPQVAITHLESYRVVEIGS